MTHLPKCCHESACLTHQLTYLSTGTCLLTWPTYSLVSLMCCCPQQDLHLRLMYSHLKDKPTNLNLVNSDRNESNYASKYLHSWFLISILVQDLRCWQLQGLWPQTLQCWARDPLPQTRPLLTSVTAAQPKLTVVNPLILCRLALLPATEASAGVLCTCSTLCNTSSPAVQRLYRNSCMAFSVLRPRPTSPRINLCDKTDVSQRILIDNKLRSRPRTQVSSYLVCKAILSVTVDFK